MEGFIIGSMAAVLLLIGGLLLLGGRALALGKSEISPDNPGPWPAAALIVPVAGAAADLAANLRSVLTQDYPDYQVIFATRDLEDPATPVIAALIPEHPRSRLIVSGPAVGCGQKNHNLLAGIKAVGETPEILVFCDATRLAPAHWLKGLILPLVRGEAPVVSGYHHVLPRDQRLAAWGRVITVLFLYLTKGISLFNQPWGGATAIKRRLFEDLQVGRLWAANVVDDVSLAALLQEKGLRVGLAPGDTLITPISGDTLTAWGDWLTRQWLYLKFCLPATWLAVGLLFYLLAGLVFLSGLMLLAAALGFSPASFWPGAFFLAALTGLSVALSALHPQPAPLRIWVLAFYAAIFVAVWCHLRTWRLRELHWRGITYRVGWKGRVVGIK
ncbi:MAG: glycosyltransferase [Deltaproteobacteria bacterium]|nr:glycosyltransferase [Deltaproteobacteria bacterium]